ncbi:MAG: hypothetical protein O2912_11955, partial [Proteobacteria bacterium]|nr:hypothetical protein [Pseudomonadota bacterium]
MPQVNVTGRPNGLIIILLLLAIVLMGLLVFAAFLQLMFQPAETFPGFSAVRSWAELLYFISGVLILITAIIAIFGARDQLRLLNASMQIDVHHRNAAVFLEMEQRWGSGEMVEARKKIGELMGSLNPNHEDTAEIRVAFEKHLAGLWASVDKSEYMEIMRPIYFLEGIGLMCARRYLEPADVDEL